MPIAPDTAVSRAGTVKKLFSGAAVLSAAAMLTKIVGLVYKIPLVKYVGIEGMAYFLAANHIYVLLFVISTAGLPVAVSVGISSALGGGDKRAVSGIYRTAMKLFLAVGVVGSGVLFFGARVIAGGIAMPDVEPSLRAISPAVLMACASGALRGYFQGHQNMLPTAISQVVEALGKLVLGLAGALWAIGQGFSDIYVAAFAISGITAGVFLSMIYLFLAKRRFDKKHYSDIERVGALPAGATVRLIKVALPVTLSSAIISLTGVIDTALIPNCLISSGYAATDANTLYSCYGNMAVPLFSLVPSLISPISTAILPIISEAHCKNDSTAENASIVSGIRLTCLLALPASAGLAIFSEPILKLIFSSSQDGVQTAAPLLVWLAISILPACLITTTNAVIQARGHAEYTIVSMSIGVAVKCVTEYFLLRRPDVGIYGAPISTFVCDMTVISVNIYNILKSSDRLNGIIMPSVKTALSAVIAVGGAGVVRQIMKSDGRFAILLPFGAAVAGYLILVYIFGAMDSEFELLLKRKNRRSENGKNRKNRLSDEKRKI